MSTPFKMKGFSGFGNSPIKQNISAKRMTQKLSATEKLKGSIKKGGTKGYLKTVLKNPTLLPKAFGESLKDVWKKHGPVINPSTKNPRGIGK